MIYDTFATLPLWGIAGLALTGLWIITSRVNVDRLARAIDSVNAWFVYKGESGLEKWRVLSPDAPSGDCEDYSLSVIYKASGGRVGFLLAVSNPFKYRLWHVTDPNGNAHLVCVCSEGAFDNHRKQLTAVSDYKSRGYKFRFFWPFPLIWLKLLIGKF